MDLKALREMSDHDLAEAHAGWKPGTANHVLCQIEWQRRLQDYGYGLAERVSRRERVASFLGALFGVSATLLAVWVAK